MAGKIFEGVVKSNKMTKTLVVQVGRRFQESRTGKIISARKTFKIHSEDNTVKQGDLVNFVECRPISKDKKFRLLTVVKRAETLESSSVDDPETIK